MLMKITASVKNEGRAHEVVVTTGAAATALSIPAKAPHGGSAINGGELLVLALATCYCNDLYREAARAGIAVEAVEVEAAADFDGVGLAATNVRYRARIRSDASDDRVRALLEATDAVAEVHNTVRAPIAVALLPWDSGL
jgi:organic hydroperoxide reductase OsmC/OhrA